MQKKETETQREKIEANGGKGNRKRKHNVKKIEKRKTRMDNIQNRNRKQKQDMKKIEKKRKTGWIRWV
jgi:hypothetical protein